MFLVLSPNQAEINSRARGAREARKCFRASLKKNWGAREEPEVLLKLQNKNGLQLGENYQNIQGAKTFTESIAHELRQHTINSLQKCRFFSLMADGSTDCSVAEQESVFVRYVVGGEPVSKFIALQEVKDARAAGVLDAIDTASVNMGIYNGVAARVKNRNGQHVTVTHCINHGLELSVLDTRI